MQRSSEPHQLPILRLRWLLSCCPSSLSSGCFRGCRTFCNHFVGPLLCSSLILRGFGLSPRRAQVLCRFLWRSRMLGLPVLQLLLALCPEVFLASRQFRVRLRSATPLLVLCFPWNRFVPGQHRFS